MLHDYLAVLKLAQGVPLCSPLVAPHNHSGEVVYLYLYCALLPSVARRGEPRSQPKKAPSPRGSAPW